MSKAIINQYSSGTVNSKPIEISTTNKNCCDGRKLNEILLLTHLDYAGYASLI